LKIYTKTGDDGETGLFGGGRTPKDSLRVAAYGEVDELNAALGLARALDPPDFADPLLQRIQRDLFSVGAQLATPDPDKLHKALSRSGAAIGESDRGPPARRPSTMTNRGSSP
jgi:ATP:cob(I)alamin adenosyltransferase